MKLFKLYFLNLITILLLLVSASPAKAQVTADDLMGLGMPGPLAEVVANIGLASGTLKPAADNTYDVGTTLLGYRTGYFDTSVITPLVSHATSLALGVAGTAEATVTNDTLTFSGAAANIVGGATSIGIGSAGTVLLRPGNTTEVTIDNGTITYADPTGYIRSAGAMIIQPDSDGQRLIIFDASSDTAITQTFGDAGVTAAQEYFLGASTTDGDDDAGTYLLGGGGSSGSRGARVYALGNEYASTGGSAGIVTGAVSTAHLLLQTGHASANVLLQPGGTTMWTAASTGTLIGAGTSNIGWTPVAAANQACNTTCVAPCVYGIDSAAPQTWLLCTDATADMCLCAGAS